MISRAVILVFLLPMSCKKEANFSTSKKIETPNTSLPPTTQTTQTRTVITPGETQIDPNPVTRPSIPCSQQETAATLLTPQIINQSSNMVLKYEIAIGNCGRTSTSMIGPIYFDMDVRSTTPPTLTYQVEGITSGTLQFTPNHDLFDRQGETFGYYKAAQFPLTTSVDKVVFSVHLPNGMSLSPSDINDQRRSFEARTFLKLGGLQPVPANVFIKSQ